MQTKYFDRTGRYCKGYPESNYTRSSVNLTEKQKNQCIVYVSKVLDSIYTKFQITLYRYWNYFLLEKTSSPIRRKFC